MQIISFEIVRRTEPGIRTVVTMFVVNCSTFLSSSLDLNSIAMKTVDECFVRSTPAFRFPYQQW